MSSAAYDNLLQQLKILRAWDAGGRPKTEDAAVRRVAERNALRCSLLRSEARKKQQPKVGFVVYVFCF